MKFWCPNCEIEMKAGLDATRTLWQVECSMCSLLMMCEIVRRPAKTYEQVTLDFNEIPLTDSQKYGGGKRKFKK